MEEEILKWIPFIIFVLGGARIFGYISERYLKQGVVLGELMFGVLIAFALKSLLPHMSTTSTFLSPVLTESKNITILLTFLSPYGVIFLLFKAGVNSHFSELCKVWKQASLVALIGVIAPGCGGYFLLILLHFTPESALLGGATLTATSVAIATRILDHHKKINSPEGNIILGAAVIDDIMGLLTLSLIPTLIILLTACNQAIDCRILTVTIAKIAIFLVLVFIIGQKIMPHGIKIIKKTTKEIRIITIFLSCLFFSYLAKQFGLATILGAFAVGLFLSDEEVKKEVMPGVEKLCFILVPIFFVNAGSMIDISVFDLSSLGIIGAIFAIAFVGKFISTFGLLGSKIDKLTVGIGMIPRGEVGLIFASYGKLHGFIDDYLYGILLAVIILTTMATPPLLEIAIRKLEKKK